MEGNSEDKKELLENMGTEIKNSVEGLEDKAEGISQTVRGR